MVKEMLYYGEKRENRFTRKQEAPNLQYEHLEGPKKRTAGNFCYQR